VPVNAAQTTIMNNFQLELKQRCKSRLNERGHLPKFLPHSEPNGGSPVACISSVDDKLRHSRPNCKCKSNC
jgi:hypothetical protein